MVKVGFIVEGSTEKIVIESQHFQTWAIEQGIEIISPVIDAEGGGNLLPQNIEPMIRQLRLDQPDHIVILTDLEYDASPEDVRLRIGSEYTNLVFIAVKALEAWFLADTNALRKWLGVDVYEDKPEETVGMPWDRLKELSAELGKRGPGTTKPGFAKKMVKSYGFSVPNAAGHPNCPSIKNFYDSLVNLSVGA